MARRPAACETGPSFDRPRPDLKVSAGGVIDVSYQGHSQGHTFLTLSGDLGSVDVPWVRQQVSRALEGEPHDLVIDMRGTYNVSREALAMLTGARTRQRNLNRQLTLVIDVDSPADWALRSTRLHDRFLVVRRLPAG
jgi:hypothetical protein